MIVQALTASAIAGALLITPGPARARLRLRSLVRRCDPARGGTADRNSPGTPIPVQELDLASAWQLLAACLRAGMPVPVALAAVCAGLGEPAGGALHRTAQLLALGADPAQAWQPAMDCPATARLARAALRSCHSGAALAESLTRLAMQARAGARAQSEARAQRAGVLIAAPLGLCFLPAFLATGVIPVLLGLASGLMPQW
jgi:pilus assembly protein TadC